MSEDLRSKVYPVPRGHVTADPGRNRYVRERGISIKLPPILNPGYSADIADPKNGIDWIGVGTQLAKTGLFAAAGVGGAVTIPLAAAGALGSGFEAYDELRNTDQKKK